MRVHLVRANREALRTSLATAGQGECRAVDLSRPPPAFSHECASPGVRAKLPGTDVRSADMDGSGDVMTALDRSISGGPHSAARRIVAELWAAGPPRSDECRPGGGEQAPPHSSSCCPVKVN